MTTRGKMKSFLKYLAEQEDQQMQTIAPPGDMPLDKQADGAKPVLPGDGNSEKHKENLKNTFNKFLNEKLLSAVKSGKISKEDALMLLKTEISAFSNMIGVDPNAASSQAQSAMATNSEPRSPIPNQPTASG